MNTYLVGGAVRDELLELPITERDWLVTGIEAETLIGLGFKPVGKSFKVFLHPITKEEYALPRGGSLKDAGELASVERDLSLRDLTINALAKAADGRIIDPLGGIEDLRAGVLRHAPGFSQDPIRILRLARLAARFADREFRIATETTALVRRMLDKGALTAYQPKRVWSEIEKALTETRPWLFFRYLRELGALKPLLPEVDRLFGVPQSEQHLPEIDTGVHSLLSLQRSCELSEDPRVRWAALLHDLGKGTTPREEWPKHIGHESRGALLAETLCRRLGAPNSYRELAVATARLHTDCHRVLKLQPETVLQKLKQLDAFRRPERLELIQIACMANLRGRPGHENDPYPQADFLLKALHAAASVDAAKLARPGEDCKDTVQRIDQARIGKIEEVKRLYHSTS